MNAKYKKSLKILSLLITAIIIGTVSATTYIYMYINGSVVIGTQKLVWLAGADASSTSITAGTAAIGLNVQPGVGQNFTEGIFLKNQDSAAHNLTITVTTALSGSDFNLAKAYIYENSTTSWAYVATLTLTTASSQYSTYTGNTPLTAGNYYRFTFEINATAIASGTKNFALEVVYE
jgi:hypothetical protein